MKFKYKKIIFAITMCTMCIGFVTISLTTPGVGKSKIYTKDKNIGENSFAEISEDASLMEDAGLKEKESALKSNNKQEITDLIITYLNSTLTCDLETLENIVTDVEKMDVEELLAKQRLIEEYQNVECYIMDGLEADDCLVYVYSEFKFTGIDTAAPGLTRLYVEKDENGAFKVQVGLMQQEVKELIDEADQSQEVQKIIDTVNRKLEEAISKDENLRTFYANLNGGSDEVDTEAMEEGGEAKPTDEPIEDTETVNE